MTAVELSEQEASAFLLFRKHQELFESLIDAGIHKICGGSATLHFRPDGKLMQVEAKIVVMRDGSVLK